MRAMAADLAAIIDRVAAGPAVVVGISLGGMVAQHLALRWPDRVRGLVLAATTCGLPHGKIPDLRFLALLLRSFGGDPEVLKALRRLLVHPRTLSQRPEVFDEWERVMGSKRTPWPALVGQLVAAAGHSTGFFLHRVTCPTVVVTGRNDRIINPRNSQILAQYIPNAELEVLEDAGHAFPLERPEAIPRAISRVMDRAGES
jgi:pimeloyl-ACP methyl ester carboxylesterase